MKKEKKETKNQVGTVAHITEWCKPVSDVSQKPVRSKVKNVHWEKPPVPCYSLDVINIIFILIYNWTHAFLQ